MICPHCGRTISEHEHYLMEMRKDVQPPRWATPAIWVLVFLFVLGTMLAVSHSGLT